MRAFDLSAAIAGAPVCTRDGREVTQLHKFDGVTYGLVGVIQGQLYTWSVDGKADTGSHRDLCMAPVKKTGWVVRRINGDGRIGDGRIYMGATIYESKQQIEEDYPTALSYHEISWEE